MRFKVPQDVQQADKIVGPLTAVQLVEAVVGGIIGYFFYTQFVHLMPLNILLATIVGIATVVVIFVKVHEMSFPQYLAALGLFFFRPRIRTWQKLSDVIFPTLTVQQQAAGTSPAAAPTVAQAQKRSLRELTKLLDNDPLRTHAPTAGEDLMESAALGKQKTLSGIHELDQKLRARQQHAAATRPDALPAETPHA